MRFYGREEELGVLQQSNARSKVSSQMTVVMGRRRIGKTRMILRSLEEEDHLYLFVSKKAERLLCQDFLRQIKTVYGEEPIGEVTQFQQVFQLICRIARRRHVNLVIDEFQEFFSINASIYSDLQRDWDLNKANMQLNLILCGSIQSMMNRIFLDGGEPLFGRASSILRVNRIYGIIKRRQPAFSKANTTTIRFHLADHFLRFWFRFVFKYQEMVEARNLPALRRIVERDYKTFAGLALEDLLREQLREQQQFTQIGNYWERGNKNEIDIVASNELDRTALIAEVKWQRKRVNLAKLELKAEKLVRDSLKGYRVKYLALGLEDVEV